MYMSYDNKKIIIAGGGSRGLYFVDMLVNNLGWEVAAIADNYIEGYEAIKYRLNEFGVPNVPIYGTLDEALEKTPREVADIVFIMTPEWTHLELFKKAISSGCHVFLEKPIATTPEDCKQIYEISKKTDRIVQVGFVLRYSSFYQNIKKIIDSGKLGKIITIQMNERLALQHGASFKRLWHRLNKYTGGFMNEKCCHDIDLMCWLMEKQAYPVELSSYAGIGFSCDKDTPDLCADCKLDNCPWRFKGIDSLKLVNGKSYTDSTSAGIGKCVFHSDSDVYDHQTINILFSDNSQGVFTVISMSGKVGRDITIHGTDGYLEGSLEDGLLKVRNYWSGETENIGLGHLGAHGGADDFIVSEFLQCIKHGKKPISTVEDGMKASLIAFAADKSVKEKIKIVL